MKRLNKKAFTLVEILVAIAILAVAVVGIGSVIISTQNNTTKRLTEADLQQQVTEIKETMHNGLLSANLGVNCWIKEGDVYKMNGDGKLSDEKDNISNEKVVALYNVDRTDFILETTYYRWDKANKTLSVAKTTDPIRVDGKIPSSDQMVQIEENIGKIINDCEWSLLSSNIDYFNVRLENPSASEKLVSVDINVSQGKSVYPVSDTVFIRNEIKTNANEFLVDKYATITLKIPTIPANSPSVFTYDGTTHTPKFVDYYDNYMTIVDNSTLSAKDTGNYYIEFELKDKKNYQWPDGTTSNKRINWSIGKRTIHINYGLNTWVYDHNEHTIDYTIAGYDRQEELQLTFTNRTIGPDVCSKICTAYLGSANFEFGNDPSTPISITPKTALADIELHPTTWNGSSQTIATVNSVEGGTVKFYTNITGVTPSKSEVVSSTCQETNANTYYVFYVVLKDGSGNYVDSDVICAGQVDIKRSQTAYAETLDFVYNNSERNTTTSSKNNGVVWSGDIKKTNAGTYTAYAEPDSNHTWSDGSTTKKTFTWTIDKASSHITAPVIANLTYTGSAQALFSTNPTTLYGSIQYKVDNGSWSSTPPTKVDAKTYKVYYYSTGDSNHYGTSPDTCVSVTIKKANGDNRFTTHPSNANPMYITQQDPVVVVTDGVLKDSNADIKYKIQIGGTWSTYSTALPEAINAGSYSVKYYIDQPDYSNYADSKEFTITCTVRKRNNAAVTKTDRTYTGSAQYGYSSKAGVTLSGDYSKTNAGTYTFKAVPDSNHTWPDGTETEKSYTWTMNKRKNTIKTEPTFSERITYDGESHYLVTAAGSSNYGPGTIEFSTDGQTTWSTTRPSKSTYGKYTIYYRAKGDSNHLAGDVKSEVVEIYLNQAQVTKEPSAKTLTYNGNNQTLINTGTCVGGTMKYKVGSSGTYSSTAPTGQNAGSYTVYWYVDGTDPIQDTAEKSFTVTIARAKTANPGTGLSLTYTGSEQGGVSGAQNVTWGGTHKATNAGSYIAKVTPDSNHAWSDGGTGTKNVSWSIARKKSATVGSVNNKTYNGSSQTGATAGTNCSLSGTTSATAAGSYSVTYKANANYAFSDGTTTKSYTWTMYRLNTASASAANKTENKSAQTGVTGSHVSWSGTTSATTYGTYYAYATPSANYAWSNGGTEQRTVTWTMHRKYTIFSSDWVRIVSGATYWGGGGIPDFVMTRAWSLYDPIRSDGRAVLKKSRDGAYSNIQSPISTGYLYVDGT